MEADQIVQKGLLFDFYGQLLTKRQREVLALYYEENLSLAEIAEEFGITRQGVHDTLKNAEKSLQEYEDKLRLVKKFRESKRSVNQIEHIIDQMMKDQAQNPILIGRLEQIKTMISKLDQEEACGI